MCMVKSCNSHITKFLIVRFLLICFKKKIFKEESGLSNYSFIFKISTNVSIFDKVIFRATILPNGNSLSFHKTIFYNTINYITSVVPLLGIIIYICNKIIHKSTAQYTSTEVYTKYIEIEIHKICANTFLEYTMSSLQIHDEEIN